MVTIPFAFYDAFSESAFGGSQAGVVSDANALSQNQRQQIASEIGAPATAFIIDCNQSKLSARFHSPLTEYSMCGHGTICLATRLVEQGVLSWNDRKIIDIELSLPASIAAVQIVRREDGRPEVLLDITPPELSEHAVNQKLLASLLGLRPQDIEDDWPVSRAMGDFTHLIVPLRDLDTMSRLVADIQGIIDFCNRYGLQTIAVFCTETVGSEIDVHMRDFCPAVGVTESAGAGTTNAALVTYLIHYGIVSTPDEIGQITVQAEQGIELQRPSSIRSIATFLNGAISRLQVGGVATKIFEGKLFLPSR